MQRAHFNEVAATYDADFSYTKTGLLQRRRVIKNLKPYLSYAESILEINCGTGIDARWLAEKGHQVTATDISEDMIANARSKQSLLDKTNPRFLVCGFDELATRFDGQSFDMVFSNFAGLNCLDQEGLKKLNNDLASLLPTNGLLAMVLFGKYCWMERLYFNYRGEPDKATRRLRMDMVEISSNNAFPVYCYTIKEIKSIFTQFEYIASGPIGFAIPPSYLQPLLIKFSFLIPIIQLAEYVCGRFSFLSDYADHNFIVFRKK